jgi:membrane fusion protein (multidrug efflux system)
MGLDLKRNLDIAVVVLIAALHCACGRETPANAPAGGAGKPIPVTATTVEPRPWVDTIEALGTAKAKESVTLTAKVTETVDRVAFEDGDYVEAGQVLVDLTGRAEVASLEEARAAHKEATQQYARQSELVDQGTVARSQLDTQVALRDAARARMEAIRARLSDRVITAPFDGVLGFRQVSPGTLVTPGTVIATLDDVSTIKLDFSVPETFLAAIAAGQEIVARSAAFPQREFHGKVRSIDSRVDPVTRAVVVRALVPNPDAALRPGMLLSVRLNKAPREVLVIPELALVQVGADAFVYRVKADASVEQVRVELGERRRGEVEIAGGLAPGDRVVVEGTVKLRPGVKVAATEAASAPAGSGFTGH